MLYYKYTNTKTIYPTSFYELEETKKKSIMIFLEGLMYDCYKEGKSFKVIDILGKGAFKNGWEDTPLIEIYKKNFEKNRKNAIRQSGIDVGNLFKNLLEKSELPFSVQKAHTNLYTPIKSDT